MSTRGYGPRYTPGKEIEEMTNELHMMYVRYEELCKAYQALAQRAHAGETNLENTTKTFGDWEKEKLEKLGDKYGR